MIFGKIELNLVYLSISRRLRELDWAHEATVGYVGYLYGLSGRAVAG